MKRKPLPVEHRAFDLGCDELMDRCRDLPPRKAEYAKRIWKRAGLQLYKLLEDHFTCAS